MNENLEAARALVAKLSENERRVLFRELGACTCAEIARQVVRSPRSVIGAVIGGVVGALLDAPSLSPPPDKPKKDAL